MLFALLTLFSCCINGEECDSARADFQANNTACLLAFERAGINTVLGFSVDSEDIDLVCNNVDCQAAIASYVGSCSLNESVSVYIYIKFKVAFQVSMHDDAIFGRYIASYIIAIAVID